MDEQKYMVFLDEEEIFFTFIKPYETIRVDERVFFVLIERPSTE